MENGNGELFGEPVRGRNQREGKTSPSMLQDPVTLKKDARTHSSSIKCGRREGRPQAKERVALKKACKWALAAYYSFGRAGRKDRGKISLVESLSGCKTGCKKITPVAPEKRIPGQTYLKEFFSGKAEGHYKANRG